MGAPKGGRLVVVGPGLRGASRCHAGGRGGLRRRRLRRRRRANKATGRRRVPRRGRDKRRGGTGPRHRTVRTHRRPWTNARIRRRRHRRPHASHRGDAESLSCRGCGDDAVRFARSRSNGHPRIDDLPGHDGRPGRRHPRGGIRAGGGGRLPPRVQPGENRPGQRHLALCQYPQSGLGHRPGVTGRRTGLLRSAGRTHGSRDRHTGGRALEAVGEHVPPREHRAGQRIGRCSPRPWASTSGRQSTPPRPSHSVISGSHPAPEWGDTACPSIPATCRGRCAGASDSRSGSSSWRTTSTHVCPTMSYPG